MSVVFQEWGREELGDRADEVLDVYAEAMGVPRMAAGSRHAVLSSHLERAGLRAVAAVDGPRLVGIGYGYLGASGQWWHDQVRAALTPVLAARWLNGAFEVCELHVRPELHGTGVGRQVLGQLLAGVVGASTSVLTTPDEETRARIFYRAGGWTDIARGLRFPGDPRNFAVLALDL